MISLMKTLGIGNVLGDSTSQAIALQYLNLAHEELYSETANINCQNFINDPNLESVAGQTHVTLSFNPFTVLKVFPIGHKFPLSPKSVLELEEYKFLNPSSGNPCFFNNIEKTLNFFPIISTSIYNFNVWYSPERTLFDENTPETAIPYPLSYQRVLVDGALYYLFQDESGFKNPKKEDQALRRWETGKINLKSYFYGANKQSISTFRSV
jgi:hypothetical protein